MFKAALGVLMLALALATAGPAAAASDPDARHCKSAGKTGDAVPTPPDDQDCDSIKDGVDNCPPAGANDFTTRNPDQTDSDADGQGDKCDDDDDNDGDLDVADNCRTVANPGQEDSNSDGIGDACANVDTDHDGLIDASDNCPRRQNPDQVDSDRDGLGDTCDNDDDDDYVADNASDNCRLTPNQDQADGDGDGVGTACDADENPFGSSPVPPATPAAPAPAQDRIRPIVRLSVGRSQAFAELDGGLVASIRCSEACKLSAQVRLNAKEARRLKLRRTPTVARGTARLAGAGRTYAFLRFDRRAKRRLWRARRVFASVRVTAVDDAGNRSVVTRAASSCTGSRNRPVAAYLSASVQIWPPPSPTC